jgi:hypothetical protein
MGPVTPGRTDSCSQFESTPAHNGLAAAQRKEEFPATFPESFPCNR